MIGSSQSIGFSSIRPYLTSKKPVQILEGLRLSENPNSLQTTSQQSHSLQTLSTSTLFASELVRVQQEPTVEIYKDTLGRSILCSSRGCTLIEIKDDISHFPQLEEALGKAEPFQALDIHAHTSSEANSQFFGNAMLADIQRKEKERPATARSGKRGYDYLVSFNDLVKLKNTGYSIKLMKRERGFVYILAKSSQESAVLGIKDEAFRNSAKLLPSTREIETRASQVEDRIKQTASIDKPQAEGGLSNIVELNAEEFFAFYTCCFDRYYRNDPNTWDSLIRFAPGNTTQNKHRFIIKLNKQEYLVQVKDYDSFLAMRNALELSQL